MSDELIRAKAAVDKAAADMEAARLAQHKATLRADAARLRAKADQYDGKVEILRRRAAAMETEADTLTELPPRSPNTITVSPGAGFADAADPRKEG